MRHMTKLMALTLAFLAPFSSTLAKDYQLAENGKSDARIQMNPHPSAPEFRAAKELQDYIKKISGADVPRTIGLPMKSRIVAKNPHFTEMLLVTLENGKYLMPEAMKEKLSKAASDDAFYIKTEGDRIVIGGKKPVGVLYGASTFIEKYLGVRWFHAGPDGEYCPKSPNIKVGDIDDFEEPSFSGRMISCWEGSVKPWKLDDVRVWQVRNKTQFVAQYTNNRSREDLDFLECGNKPLSGGGGHMTFENAVPKELFAVHPEYFPMTADGKRVCEERSQRCLANPDVQKMVVDYALEATAYGAEYMISFHDVTYSSGNSWCRCPECMKMGTYNGKFTVSNLAHRFTSMIADRILKRNPDAQLAVEIYTEFRELPTDPSIHYDPRVLGRYAPHQRCYVHRFEDQKSECNTKYYKWFLDWLKVCPKMELFDFYACARSPYAPMEYVLASDLKLYKKHGLAQWWEDCTNKDLPILSSNWQFYYVASKMLWDSSLDVEKILDEAYEKYYGAAAVPMKKYHAMRRELWEQAPGHALYGGPTRIAYCLTVPGAEKRLKGFLDEADKLAGNDATLKRRIAADRGRLEEFWGKEAEKMKKVMAGQNSIPARELTGKITIDGSLEEEDWKSAQLVTGFRTITENGDPTEPVEETRAKVLFDKDNWYVSFEAMTEHAWGPLKTSEKDHDGKVWNDDSVEIFLAPSDSDYYQWIINSAGVFYDAKGRNTEFESKAEIKTKVLKDRYVVEARIPAASMGAKIDKGGVWHMHLCRTCRNLQPPKDSESSSLDGVQAHDQTLFKLIGFGQDAPMMWNGGFEDVNEMGALPKGWASGNTPALMPTVWCMHEKKGTATVVKEGVHSGKNAWKIEKGMVTNYFPTLTGDKIHFEFWAKGSGKVLVMLPQYSKQPDGGSKFIGTDSLCEIDLTPEWKRYEIDHTINRKETQQAGLAFDARESMTIDDVAPPKIQRQGGAK